MAAASAAGRGKVRVKEERGSEPLIPGLPFTIEEVRGGWPNSLQAACMSALACTAGEGGRVGVCGHWGMRRALGRLQPGGWACRRRVVSARAGVTGSLGNGSLGDLNRKHRTGRNAACSTRHPYQHTATSPVLDAKVGTNCYSFCQLTPTHDHSTRTQAP